MNQLQKSVCLALYGKLAYRLLAAVVHQMMSHGDGEEDLVFELDNRDLEEAYGGDRVEMDDEARFVQRVFELAAHTDHPQIEPGRGRHRP